MNNEKHNTIEQIRVAIQHGKPRIFKKLLAKMANVNAKDRDGNTPFLFAVYYGRIQMAKKLLELGADLEAKNNLDWNALMEAAGQKNPEMVEFLINKGISLNKTGKATRFTALIIAVTKGHDQNIRLLLEAGADPSIHATNGKTAQTTALANYYGKTAAIFGEEVKPHFKPISASKAKQICAYCGEKLNDGMIANNFCEDCDAYYCDIHYQWSQWRPPDQTCPWDERNGTCPNAHRKNQGS